MSDPADTSAASVVRVQRTFVAPPEDVFDAWTNPEVLRRWWSGGPHLSSPGCDVDLRVGGRYVMRMCDERSGEQHVVVGEYREIERPHRLVYTWAWQGGPNPGHESVVTVEFHADGERTTVVLEHAGLPDDGSRARHGEGWRAAFDSLGRAIFGDDQRSGESVAR